MELFIIFFVQNVLNPLNISQICLITHFWGLKTKKMKSIHWKINKIAMEIISEVYVRVFQKWRPKINLAMKNGLDSLLKY